MRDGERLLLSSVAGRTKVSDVEQTGWASLCVMGPQRPFPSVTVSGAADVLTRAIGPAAAAIAQRFVGADEPPAEQSDGALTAVGRLIIAMPIEQVAAVTHLEQ